MARTESWCCWTRERSSPESLVARPPERPDRVIEDALASLQQDRGLRRAQRRPREDARERGHGVFHRRQRLVRPAINHARPDVGILNHDAELERGEPRARPHVGRDALVDRDAAREARGGAGAAHRVAGEELGAREHVPHALHVVVAGAVACRFYVDAVEDQELLLKRRQGLQNGRQLEVGLGPRREPAVEDGAVGREDDDEALRRRGRPPDASWQEGGRSERRARAEQMAP